MNVSSQVAAYLNIDENRVSLEPGDRIIIDCANDRQMIDIQSQWCYLTFRFHNHAKYLLLKNSGGRDVEYPIGKSALKMFASLYPTICTPHDCNF